MAVRDAVELLITWNEQAAPLLPFAGRAPELRRIQAAAERGQLILIEGDHIVSITAAGSAPAGVQLIDLSQATVLPGFVDTHTHLLLNGDITAEDYDVQLLKQSIPYRAILSARNARIALDQQCLLAGVARRIHVGHIVGGHHDSALFGNQPTQGGCQAGIQTRHGVRFSSYFE